jgi:hypothetical protein
MAWTTGWRGVQAGVAGTTPLTHQRRVQAVTTQIPVPVALGDGLLVLGEQP